MSTRAGRGCKVAGRFPSGLTFLCGFLMILSARGWPLLQVPEPWFWPGTGFDCRRTNEAIGRYSIAVNELQPHFGFVRAPFPRHAVSLAWHFEPPDPQWAELGIHGLKSWGRNLSRKVRETRSSSSQKRSERGREVLEAR